MKKVLFAVCVMALAVMTAGAFTSASAAEARTGPAGKRVVALTPFAANTLASLGVRPVAIGQTLGGTNRFARSLRGTRVLPLSHPNGPNLEQLAQLRPDSVFTSSTWSGGHQAMRALGINVFDTEPERVGSAISEIRRISRLVGRVRLGNRLAQQVSRQIAAARAGIESRPDVLMILGVGRSSQVFLPSSWGGNLVRLAGGDLVTGGVTGSSGFARISDEEILISDPDVIIAVPHAGREDIPGIIDHLKSNPAWASTDAAENDRVYVSVNNSLLQAGTDIARTIRQVRAHYLDNWTAGQTRRGAGRQRGR